MSRSEIQTSVPASAASPIDRAHLRASTLADDDLAAEVLRLFLAQTGDVAPPLHGLSKDIFHLMHKLKGSARAIGAWRVADAAEGVEATLAAGDDPAPALSALMMHIAAAREDAKMLLAHVEER